MAFAVMKIGDAGENVATLKRLLKGAGYEVTDGDIFDEQTSGSVSAYQRANGLKETGEAGASTWAKLASSAVVSMPSDLSTQESVSYLEKNRPKVYQSDYQAQIDELLSQVMNREEFAYDPVQDPLYQKYKDQYTYLGKRAMNDAIGQGAALSGGYANSYALGAGQQAYQDYLVSLTSVLPELQSLALKSYDQESSRLSGALNALRDAEGEAYDRYLDDMDAYNDALEYYYKKLQDEQDQENWLYKNKPKKSGSSSSSSNKTTAAAAPVQTAPETTSAPANLLTYAEFVKRREAGAESLKKYASYTDYYNAMLKKYA